MFAPLTIIDTVGFRSPILLFAFYICLIYCSLFSAFFFIFIYQVFTALFFVIVLKMIGLLLYPNIFYKIANTRWIIEKARKFQKIIYLCSIHSTKAFECVDHDKLWKALREMKIPHHLTYLLRNLYAGQEATVRTLYGTTDWFKIEKGVRQV